MRTIFAGKNAFTLVEMLVVIAIITILASLLMPVLNKGKESARGAQDISNKKQLMQAWVMYAGEFHDYMVPNSPIGWTGSVAWIDSVNGLENWGYGDIPYVGNTNDALLKQALLAPYLAGQIGIYKCPADRLPSANGTRLRSVSMNGQMGAVGQTLTNGPGKNNAPGELYVKMTDLNCPAPALAIVFVDESMATLQDGYLQVDTHGNKAFFPDIPANYHGGGCCVGYADGHSEIHKWQTSPLLGVPYNQNVGYPNYTISGVNSNNVDWQWWIQRIDCDQN
jgi:prepilin-type N-terminal cleavage/methylation domain-containing protein/prepilin-type processing-associated H-X9-DG protein